MGVIAFRARPGLNFVIDPCRYCPSHTCLCRSLRLLHKSSQAVFLQHPDVSIVKCFRQRIDWACPAGCTVLAGAGVS